MEYTVTFGWWLVPALMTLFAYVWVITNQNPYAWRIKFLGGSVVALIAWLVWAVLT